LLQALIEGHPNQGLNYNRLFLGKIGKRDCRARVRSNTHFIELNNQRVVILGCRNLNVFNPRAQANASPHGCKKQIADTFKSKRREFKPDIILQHPHTTDTPNIWSLAWRIVEKELTCVKHFASGIMHHNERRCQK
jgi:hypothetical protein